MVMWFNIKKAREHLLMYGFVYTLRPPSKRKDSDGIRKTGTEVLMFDKCKKRGLIDVTFIMKINNINDINTNNNIYFLRNSGFSSLEEWEKASNNSKYLYSVKVIKITDFGDDN